MGRKRERFINYALILLTIAYVLFVTVYDYHRITVYGDALEESGEKVGYALGMTIVFVLFNICILGGASAAVAIALFALTKGLAKNNGKSKKGVAIAILVFKIIGCAVTIFGAVLAFSHDHSDWVMKVFYAFTAAAYLAATAHSIIYFKEIV